ncbi:unnamed protein product [Symbiodinium natans]|uniref:Uncharacterized protein n=1 Tax=Symbiodinium natans TaxID=878477 RepID=A0A812NDB3_9DINO|nr:unnamed protein product [Symbiodinium natans]
MVVFGGSNGMRRHNDVFEFHMAPKIPPCSLSADLEAIFESTQREEAMQRSCDLFLAAGDSDWIHGVYCHQHVILVRCPPLFRLVQERGNGMPIVEGFMAEPRGGMEEELDTLLRVVNDAESGGKKASRRSYLVI